MWCCFRLVRLSFLLILSLSWCRSDAQRYPFYNLSIEQGLIQSQTTSLAQDTLGHLWIGTLGGLARYDGRSFTSYSIRDGLPDNFINVLHLAPDGKLWIGTQKGLAIYDGTRFRPYIFQSAENPQGNMIYSIATSGSDKGWCIAGKQIFAVNDGKVQSLALPGRNNIPMALQLDADGGLLVSFQKCNALYRYHNQRWDSTMLPPAPAPYYIPKMYTDRQQRTWLLGNNGALVYDATGVHKIPLQMEGRQQSIIPTCMVQSRDGSYWMGTSSGCVRLTDSTLRVYNRQNGLTGNAIYDLLLDAEGNVWMASDGQGLFRFSGAPFTALDERMKLPSAQIMALAAGSREELFIGTYDAGLFVYQNDSVRPLPAGGRIISPIIALAVLKDDLWIGTRGSGLLRYGKGITQLSAKANGLPSNSITALRTTPDNRLWIGCSNGAAYYEDDSLHVLPLTDDVVYDFLPVGDSILIATNDGIRCYYHGKIWPFITGSAPDSSSPECLAVQQGRIWIGTSDNGIIVYDFDRRASLRIDKSNGLRSDFIYNIIAAADGSVWAGTGFGIYNIRMTDGKPKVTFYGRGQGVTGLESNHNAVLGMPDGSIWFGTTNGAMHYRPGTQQLLTSPRSIVMQYVRLFGEQITDTNYYTAATPIYKVPLGLRLPPQKNNLTFSFQAVTLSDEGSVLYRYKMQGLEGQWSDWSATNTITYPALPSGRYTLLVQCSVNGRRMPQELRYPFEIVTPFHKTTLFRLIILGGCILLGVSLQYVANRRKQARLRLIDNLRREEQAKVRVRTAEDFHDEVGNKLTRINVLTNVLKARLPDAGPDALRIIDQIQDNTGQLYSGTRDILWSLSPSNDNAYELLHRIRDFGRDLFGDTDVRFDFSGTDEAWRDYRLPMDASRNLLMIFKEAMNNILKYAGATAVTLTVSMPGPGVLALELSDNGRGFDPDAVKRGNGLNNMATRARRLEANFSLESAPGNGTTLRLQFNIPRTKG